MSRGCPEVHAARARGLPLDEELLAHAADCPLCAEGADGADAATDRPPPVAAVTRAIEHERRGLSTRARWAVVGAVAAVMVVGMAVKGPLPSGLTLVGCAAVATAALGAGALSLPAADAVPVMVRTAPGRFEIAAVD
ncbi:MAG: hypothetical protein ABMA64_36320, partial [Myxococcota bacterium]